MLETLHVFATLMIGLYAGSLLTEAMILVPYWRRMEAAEFLRLHGTLGPKLFHYFAPLTTIAVGASVLSGVFGNEWRVLSAVLCAGALVIFFLYFKKANASFAAQSLKAEDLQRELSRWANWHWLRTVLLLIAFLASILGFK